MRLLKSNSVKVTLVNTNEILSKDNVSYPATLVHKVLTDVQFSDRAEAQQNKEGEINLISIYHTSEWHFSHMIGGD